MPKVNGAIKVIGIIVSTLLVLGGIIWGFATQSGNLTRVVKDVTTLETAVVLMKNSVHEIDKSVVLIQNNVKHMKDDIAGILSMKDDIAGILTTQESILSKLE